MGRQGKNYFSKDTERTSTSGFTPTKIVSTDFMILGAGLGVLLLIIFIGQTKEGTPDPSGVIVSGGSTTTAPKDTTSKSKDTTTSSDGDGAVSGDGFAIGNGTDTKKESQQGSYRPLVVLKTVSKGSELSTADKLDEESKKLKKAIAESSVAEELKQKSKRVKNQVESAHAAPMTRNSNMEHIADEYPEKTPSINIDRQGYGHSRAPLMRQPPRAAFNYPDSKLTIKYKSSNTLSKTNEADTRGGSQSVPVQLKLGHPPSNWDKTHLYEGGRTYAQVVDANDQIQKQRDNAGFSTDVYKPVKISFRDDPGYNGYWDYEAPASGRDIVEKAVADTGTATSHSFKPQKNGRLKSGIGSEEWQKQKTNWDEVKGKVLTTTQNIVKLFDRLFAEELFADAVIDKKPNGQVFIRDGKEGKCIRVDRYYEYVETAIKAQLSLEKVGPLSWAKSVELSFDSIEKNKEPLRSALLEKCGKSGKSGFLISSSGEVKTAEGDAISITLPWPKDRSTLLDHPMKFKKSK